ncbi:MAG TPA: homocysteine S-methyltransferase family protein [Candidatus Xenobia bacterium]|nr:homocysteine S-methyltransferase family protein [Candidatus Xenobia bacterium]
MYEQLHTRLEKRQAVLLDGAMGAELVRRGVRWRKHGLLTDADKVQQLHEEYLAAGADVIRTNTFQLNPRIFLNVFRDHEHMAHIGAPGLAELTPKLIRTSVQVARAARAKAGREKDVAIAGVLSPLEHCYRPDLSPAPEQARREHEEQARLFAGEKVDLILLESMNNIAEAKAAAAACTAAGLPFWASFVLGPEGELLSREPLADAVKEMEKAGAKAVLVNCAPPGDITKALGKLRSATSLPFGGFAHIGRFSPPSWKFEFFPQFIDTEEWPPERYVAEAQRWRESGATIIGGCCGTGPAHIAALRAWLGRNGGAR